MQAFEKFSNLEIWKSVGKRLDWYRKVSVNAMPAKYLIAKFTDTDISRPNGDQDIEWMLEAFGKSIETFLELKRSIERGAEINELEKPKYSLLDLAKDLTRNMLRSCIFCRWRCNVDRMGGKKLGACMLTDESRVSSFFHHTGEELVFRGTHGSGTIFFTSCNMRCLFCQNSDISRDRFNGIPYSGEDIAKMIYVLRNEGCHNVNYVGGEPTIHLHTIVDSIWHLANTGFQLEPTHEEMKSIRMVKNDYFPYAQDRRYSNYHGMFNIPVLFNTNMFLSDEALLILRPLVDIWLPDFKFGPKGCAVRLSRTPWYYETVSANLIKINEWDEDIMIRHLIMPNHVECCTKPILKWVSDKMPDVPVNIMAQYRPVAFADPSSPQFDKRAYDIARRPYERELTESWKFAEKLGLNFKSATFDSP